MNWRAYRGCFWQRRIQREVVINRGVSVILFLTWLSHEACSEVKYIYYNCAFQYSLKTWFTWAHLQLLYRYISTTRYILSNTLQLLFLLNLITIFKLGRDELSEFTNYIEEYIINRDNQVNLKLNFDFFLIYSPWPSIRRIFSSRELKVHEVQKYTTG